MYKRNIEAFLKTDTDPTSEVLCPSIESIVRPYTPSEIMDVEAGELVPKSECLKCMHPWCEAEIYHRR